MKVSNEAIYFLVGWEGIKLQVYNNQDGLPTIGIGHLLTKMELDTKVLYIGTRKIAWRNGISRDDAYALKMQDMEKVEGPISNMLPGLSQNEFDAVCIFAFDIEMGAFLSSTVFKLLRAGDRNVEEAWGRFRLIKVNGKKVVSKGLVKRRAAEYNIFSKGDYSDRP